jgi:hypothetical protein
MGYYEGMGYFPIVWGVKLSDQKIKIESNGALGLHVCHRMGGHNKQMIAVVSGLRDIGEEMRWGRNVWGGVVSSFRVAN